MGNYSEMPKSAFIINHNLSELVFWTNYSIQASLCNSKGCGAFSENIFVRTDEHVPTCAPNVTLFQNTSSTNISAAWMRTPVNCTHGELLFFNVFFSLESELNGTECFNESSCWELYSPVLMQTKFYVTNVTDLEASFPNLKKYKQYCIFLQAVNIKGRGPVSHRNCAFTAEDGK